MEIIDKYRYSRFQTMRGALADAEQNGKIYLFKNVSELHLTYQIRLLVLRAKEENMKLNIEPQAETLKRKEGKKGVLVNGN